MHERAFADDDLVGRLIRRACGVGGPARAGTRHHERLVRLGDLPHDLHEQRHHCEHEDDDHDDRDEKLMP